MPDKKGDQKADQTETPLHAYKEGREEEVEAGSLGVDTGGPGEQRSRLPEAADEKGSFQAGGFDEQETDSAATDRPPPVTDGD